jgi:hypothetical protein
MISVVAVRFWAAQVIGLHLWFCAAAAAEPRNSWRDKEYPNIWRDRGSFLLSDDYEFCARNPQSAKVAVDGSNYCIRYYFSRGSRDPSQAIVYIGGT